MQGEARRLSFRALDIEQIGHVYEGLLDHTAKRAPEPMLGLTGTKGKEPEVALAELERLQAKGEAELLEFLNEETGRQERTLKNALATPNSTERMPTSFRAVCGNDDELFQRVRPFAGSGAASTPSTDPWSSPREASSSRRGPTGVPAARTTRPAA